MLDRECGEVCIRRNIAGCSQRFHKSAQNCEVAANGVEDKCAWLSEPALDDIEGLIRGERIGEELRAGRKSHEREQDQPGEANRLGAGKDFFQPWLSSSMEG